MISRALKEDVRRGLLAGVAILTLLLPPAGPPRPAAAAAFKAIHPLRNDARLADFGSVTPGPEVRHLANWIADSADNLGAAFVIVDKRAALVFVFDAQARLRGSSPALLGSAPGDDSVAGIGTRPIEQVRPDERTTPAGRFVAEHGRNAHGDDIVWIDYDAAVSMHRVRTNAPAEQRLQRLATPSADDNRISYGCINLPVAFYDSHISPAFAERPGVVYVLPEQKSVQQVFGSYDVAQAREVAMNNPSHAGTP